MSSLKDIMDVDVEPLESQAYRRSNEAGNQELQTGKALSSASQSPKRGSREPPSLRIRKSNRVSKPPTTLQTSRPGLLRRRSSGATENIESQSLGQSSSQQGMRQTLRGMDSSETQVRYTPVTGRISRAKKGQHVHICEQCDEPRVFSRAEHLRRHQLSHQQPRFPCTFEDCEKTFHRPDLLARHLHRHEFQGEAAYKAGDSRSRSPSGSLESQTPPLNVETPLGLAAPGADTSGIPASTSSTLPATTYDPIMGGFRGESFANTSNERSTSQMNRGPPAAPQGSTGAADENSDAGLRNLAEAFHADSIRDPLQPEDFLDMGQSSFNQMFQNPSESYQSSEDPHDLPLLSLQVPDQSFPPSLTHTNSPWYSSDSPWSTPSDASRRGSAWPRDRSASITTTYGWNDHSTAMSPQFIPTPIPSLRSPGLEMVPEHYESPPFASPLSPPLLTYQIVSVPGHEGTFQAGLVSTQSVSRPCKSAAQVFPMPSYRIPPFAWSALDGEQISLVDVEDLHPSRTTTGLGISEEQMDIYLMAYKTRFERKCCIVHPNSYDHLSPAVKYATAALGAQFHYRAEDRNNGSQLNECCRKLITLPLEWNVSNMQAILLTEIYERFRSSKIDLRPSIQFRELYKKLLQYSLIDSESPFARLNSADINAYIEVHLQSHNMKDTESSRRQILHDIWRQWVDFEIRQRLRTTCFIFDIHQSIYYEQRRCQPGINTENTYLVFPCQQNLWTARNSQQWFDRIHQSECSTVQLVRPGQLSTEQTFNLPQAAQNFILCSLIARLPVRNHNLVPSEGTDTYSDTINTIYAVSPVFSHAHAYLALYHTPLHDLLSLTGDTWLFGRKITSVSDMVSVKESVNKWSRTTMAAQATWHACHVIRLYISNPPVEEGASSNIICQYWAAYTAAIICWAFGRAAPVVRQPLANGAPRVSFSNPSVKMSSLGSSWATNGCSAHDTSESNGAAFAYVESMIAFGPAELSSAPMCRETGPVLEAVLKRLRIEASEGQAQCAMMLDACGVLDRLIEGGR